MKPLVTMKKPTFKYGSATYWVLAYACAYDKAFTIDEMQQMSNKRFDDKHAIKRALDVLSDNRSVEKLNDTYWAVTPLGKLQVFYLAEKKQQA